MNRRGNCYDNAPTEGFQGTLKNGLMHHRRYAIHVSRPRSRSLSISTCFTIASRVRPGWASSDRPHCLTWRAFVRTRLSKTICRIQPSAFDRNCREVILWSRTHRVNKFCLSRIKR
jgi:hypothetical protein